MVFSLQVANEHNFTINIDFDEADNTGLHYNLNVTPLISHFCYFNYTGGKLLVATLL